MSAARLFVSAALVCFAGAGAYALQGAPAGGEAPGSAPVSVTVKTDKKQYKPGDPVKLTLTVKNPSGSVVRLNFSSGMKYDFIIRGERQPAGAPVWQWSSGRMFTQMLSTDMLEPGKMRVFTETFTPGAIGGSGTVLPALTPGTYRVTGILALSGRAPRPMASTVFKVKAGKAHRDKTTAEDRTGEDKQ